MYKIIQLCILEKQSPVKSVIFLGFMAIYIFLLSQKIIKKCFKNTSELQRSHHKVSHFFSKNFFQPFFLNCSQQKGQETNSQSDFYPDFGKCSANLVQPDVCIFRTHPLKYQKKTRNHESFTLNSLKLFKSPHWFVIDFILSGLPTQ